MPTTLISLAPSLSASQLPYGFFPMVLFSRATAPLFRFMGGYALVHFLRCNALFYAPPSTSGGNGLPKSSTGSGKTQDSHCLTPCPKWLPLIGGPIYDGKYTPAAASIRKKTPTLSEILARELSSSNVMMAGLLVITLMGAGLSGVSGCAAAFLFDGQDGRLRYQVVRHLVGGGKTVVLPGVPVG